MTETAQPYRDVRAMLESLTLDAGDLAKVFKAEVYAATTLADRNAAADRFERLFKAACRGAAYLVRLDEAVLKLAKGQREDAQQVRDLRVRTRMATAKLALEHLPEPERLPQLTRLANLARDPMVTDGDFTQAVANLTATINNPRHPTVAQRSGGSKPSQPDAGADSRAPPLRRTG